MIVSRPRLPCGWNDRARCRGNSLALSSLLCVLVHCEEIVAILAQKLNRMQLDEIERPEDVVDAKVVSGTLPGEVRWEWELTLP